jgi:hypothetical protein
MAKKKAHKSRRSHGKRKMPLKLIESRVAKAIGIIHHRGGHVPGYTVTRRKAKHRKGR